MYGSVNGCPTRYGTPSELLNSSRVVYREWFCTTAGEEGRYYLGVRAAETLDPLGAVPGYVLPNGRPPTSSALVSPSRAAAECPRMSPEEPSTSPDEL